VLARQTLIIIRTVNSNVFFDARLKRLTDLVVDSFVSSVSQLRVREVSVHAGTVPVHFAEWLWMVIDRHAIFFAASLKDVASQPNLVTSFFGTFGEDLEFPLASSNF